MKKMYMVTDLGPGDGGKGGVVHKLSHMQKAHTIVKVGGAQGSHGVRTSNGQSFNFSQFGCGTFEGVNTHLSPRFVIDPIGIINEGAALQYEAGVYEPFALMTIDSGAICNTPFHGIASRIKEIALGGNPRGTIGTGVGQAYRMSQSNPELTIYASDLGSHELKDKLVAVQKWIQTDLAPIIAGEFLGEDVEIRNHEVSLLHDPGFIDYICGEFKKVYEWCRIVPHDYFGDEILEKDGVIVVESSHGILTDSFTGFHPHTSALRTLPHFTRDMFIDAGYGGQIVSLGVHRAYQIRHGAGPMVTSDPLMTDELLPGSYKKENRYQGKIRVGPLDLVSLRYALAASGVGAYDGLAITWFDQIEKLGHWKYCNHYCGAQGLKYFSPPGEIRVRAGNDEAQIAHLGQLTKQLQACLPEVTTVSLKKGATRDELYELCAGTLLEHLGVPVRMISFGPTERDKVTK